MSVANAKERKKTPHFIDPAEGKRSQSLARASDSESGRETKGHKRLPKSNPPSPPRPETDAWSIVVNSQTAKESNK